MDETRVTPWNGWQRTDSVSLLERERKGLISLEGVSKGQKVAPFAERGR